MMLFASLLNFELNCGITVNYGDGSYGGRSYGDRVTGLR